MLPSQTPRSQQSKARVSSRSWGEQGFCRSSSPGLPEVSLSRTLPDTPAAPFPPNVKTHADEVERGTSPSHLQIRPAGGTPCPPLGLPESPYHFPAPPPHHSVLQPVPARPRLPPIKQSRTRAHGRSHFCLQRGNSQGKGATRRHFWMGCLGSARGPRARARVPERGQLGAAFSPLCTWPL